ncbi:MAG: hypothetical protein JXO22_11455 [Phycisphaerae bacterium]|nr:hypothetical protein [Phycisphaerae bacterium]
MKVLATVMAALVVLTAAAETITVKSTDANGENSAALVRGRDYWIVAEGTWYRDSVHICDTEWYEYDLDGDWREEYSGYPGLLDLLIDDTEVDWQGWTGGEWKTHTYSSRHRYRTKWTGTGDSINLRISADHYPGENSGSLKVTISEADEEEDNDAPEIGEKFSVCSTDGSGVTSPVLRDGQWYLFEVSGTWYRDSVHIGDAEWYEFDSDGDWREEYSGYPGLLDLQIDRTSPDWLGSSDGRNYAAHTYSPSHRYRLYYEGQGRSVNLRIYDDAYPGENSGCLDVRITETDPPDSDDDDTPEIGEEFSVCSTDGSGVTSPVLADGQWYLFEVSGLWYRDSVHIGDAEWYEYDLDGDWREEYSGYPGLLDLQIDGQSPDWLGSSNGGNYAAHTYSPSHRYRLYYEGQGRSVNLRIYDDAYPGENSGCLDVVITKTSRPESSYDDTSEADESTSADETDDYYNDTYETDDSYDQEETGSSNDYDYYYEDDASVLLPTYGCPAASMLLLSLGLTGLARGRRAATPPDAGRHQS